jgi:hypothetical protein
MMTRLMCWTGSGCHVGNRSNGKETEVSDTDKIAITLRALRASGDERAADVVQAILGSGEPAPVAPSPGETAPAGVPAEVQALGNEQKPPGALTKAQLRDMTAAEISRVPKKQVDAALAEGDS